ncbi:hypothetical protein HN419_00735 [Candidatus Woesearchaeota archaeon]|jgi:hypothetical protein|nr:hypothetical protein [Candidatus Woesearchaeota archaeon]MBT3537477.1 hypothetical protein [Candidatus Woesearchaeota archaeon]MBT4697254.1 hypothetical protein [Candidatus Woesearchaeota archaeon]MBT4717352.1 hypothetical protein [Candidatus Woesearchaeota archaeon]MBT7106213.1 hypothetical protein [Candidatus Woesearchaeota archaeon]
MTRNNPNNLRRGHPEAQPRTAERVIMPHERYPGPQATQFQSTPPRYKPSFWDKHGDTVGKVGALGIAAIIGLYGFTSLFAADVTSEDPREPTKVAGPRVPGPVAKASEPPVAPEPAPPIATHEPDVTEAPEVISPDPDLDERVAEADPEPGIVPTSPNPLANLLYNTHRLKDIFLYNAVIGDNEFAYTSFIPLGTELEGADGTTIDFDDDYFTFKVAIAGSNRPLPERLPPNSPAIEDFAQDLSTFVNRLTRFNIDNEADLERLANMIAFNYKYSFGIDLDTSKISFEADPDTNEFAAIKYTGANAKVEIEYEAAESVDVDEADPYLERTLPESTRTERETLTDINGLLRIPYSMNEQHVLLIGAKDLRVLENMEPFSYEIDDPTVSVPEDSPDEVDSFRSIEIDFGIQDIVDSYNLVDHAQPNSIPTSDEEGAAHFINPLKYVFATRDANLGGVADAITAGLENKVDQAQALLDFTHTLEYGSCYPAYARNPIVSLVGGARGCELDAVVMYSSLLAQKGIGSILLGYESRTLVAVEVAPEDVDPAVVFKLPGEDERQFVIVDPISYGPESVIGTNHLTEMPDENMPADLNAPYYVFMITPEP